MSITRRDCLRVAGGTVAAGLLHGDTAVPPGIPGPFRGKVVAVGHQGCIVDRKFQAEPIRGMVARGMCELTAERQPADAWRRLFGSGDTVGIKMSPNGRPHVCSSPEMLRAVIAGLQSAGVKTGNIVVFERYQEILETAGIPSWVPEGVKVEWASPGYTAVQQDMDGYDADHFVDLAFTLPRFDVNNTAARRSYVAKFLTQRVDKLINLTSLKTHNAAGVTLALKNLSHGLVNNVSRSHDGPALRLTEFIPAVVGSPMVRTKTVLNILDGTRGLYHGGPGINAYGSQFVWEHKTVYFATDPVAMDAVGMSAIEAKRKQEHLMPIKLAKPDEGFPSPVRQPEYIESAGQAGLGESDFTRIALKHVQLS